MASKRSAALKVHGSIGRSPFTRNVFGVTCARSARAIGRPATAVAHAVEVRALRHLTLTLPIHD
jgi:hypothetical protein